MSEQQDDGEIIFRPWITRDGKRVYASWYGLKAFPIRVSKKKREKESGKVTKPKDSK